LVQRGIAAWNRGDDDASLVGLHREIEWTAGLIDADETFHGHEGVQRFWRIFREAWKDIQLDVGRYLEIENKVIVLGHFQAVGRDSGIPIEGTLAQVFEFRDGMVGRFQAHPSVADALADAGVDPAAFV